MSITHDSIKDGSSWESAQSLKLRVSAQLKVTTAISRLEGSQPSKKQSGLIPSPNTNVLESPLRSLDIHANLEESIPRSEYTICAKTHFKKSATRTRVTCDIQSHRRPHQPASSAFILESRPTSTVRFSPAFSKQAFEDNVKHVRKHCRRNGNRSLTSPEESREGSGCL